MTREQIDNEIENLELTIDELMLGDEEANAEKVASMRKRVEELKEEEPDIVEFKLHVCISGTGYIDAETLEEAKAKMYDAVKNHPEFVVEFLCVEED